MELLKNNKRIFPLIGAIIVFILSFSVLYMGDNIGLSDNGDFRRVLLVNNMEYENDSNYYYLFKQDYKMKVEGAGFWDKITYLCESNSEEDIYSSPQFIIISACCMRFSIVWNWRSYVGLLISLMPKRGGIMGRLPKLHDFQLGVYSCGSFRVQRCPNVQVTWYPFPSIYPSFLV